MFFQRLFDDLEEFEKAWDDCSEYYFINASRGFDFKFFNCKSDSIDSVLMDLKMLGYEINSVVLSVQE